MALVRAGLAAMLVAASVAAPPAQAATLNQFTSFWALGDSLSDPGNLYAATKGVEPPSPPYFEGRFSNGPVWAEYIAADFAAKGLISANVAFGGAQALPNADAIPDLATQVGLFGAVSAGKLGSRPLASIWIGANDLVSDGVPDGNARRVGRAAARSVADGARALAAQGVGDVLLFNLPNLAGTPLYAQGRDAKALRQAKAGSRAFNATLARQVARLEKGGLNVIGVDAAKLFRDLLDDPASFGLVNATIPCLAPGRPPCGPALAQALAFYDPLHPNSVVHEAIADVVREKVAPVPLPAPAALLVAAVAGLMVARRRRGRGVAAT